MKKFLKREPVKRGLRTFIQAVAGYIVVNVVTLDFSSNNAVKGFIIAAIAAGIAAAMNIKKTDESGENDDN